MQRYYFDIEANALLETVSKIWCVCAVNLDTKEEHEWGPDQIEQALTFLSEADLLVAHNGIRYDFPALLKVCGWEPTKPVRHDTLILARLVHPNIKKTDTELVLKKTLHSSLHGKDTLKAWGQRIGIHKAEYEGGFDAWSPEMQDYCLQDCRTGAALYDHLDIPSLDPRSVSLEHRVAEVCFKMEEAGWPFNEKAAGELYTRLVARKEELETGLVARFGSWQEVDKVFTPKRDDKKRGYVKGMEVTKYKTVTFNPGSRQHIIKKLMEAGWKPEVFTESGQPKLDEDVLESLDVPEAKDLIEFLLVQKRLGQIADGNNGWLKLVKNGKIHASYNTMGTVTGRASHFNPNIAQTPKNKSPYGAECRDLFTVPKGWKLLGADFEGLELRCLASYMHAFDGGAYCETVCDGDVHTVNQTAAGLPTRDNAKTFIYGFLYGAGDEKIGKIVGGSAMRGKALKERFLAGLPALRVLRQRVTEAVSGKKRDGITVLPGRPWLKGLDGRHIPVRSGHAALNSLLQSAGAVLCKTWLVNAYDKLIASGLKWGWSGDFVIVGWIHDELQVAVREQYVEDVGAILVECAQRAGDNYGFKCRLDSKYVPGNSWKDTH